MSDRLDELQVLRFAAALGIVFFHLPMIDIGEFGVDIFFVLSGFIICMSTHKDQSNFFAKRVIRVVPIYWLATLGVFAIALLLPTWMHSTTADLSQLVKSLLFIPFTKGEVRIKPLLEVGWTLNYEMIFYAVFAISIRFSKGYHEEVACLGVIILFVLGRLLGDVSAIWQFLGNSIILEFVLGALLWRVWLSLTRGDVHQERQIDARLLAWLAAAAILTAILTIMYGAAEERFIFYGIPACVIVASALTFSGKLKFPRVLIFAGDCSYSLYLSHIFVVVGFDRLLNFFDTSGTPLILAMSVAVGTSILTAAILYVCIERPISQFFRSKL